MARQIAVREPRLRLNLERLRKKRGVSLESISEATKISRRFLQAIEGERFDELPGGVFNTSYLKQYAEAIGMDETPLLNLYHAWADPPSNGEPVPAKRSGWSRWFRPPTSLSGSGA